MSQSIGQEMIGEEGGGEEGCKERCQEIDSKSLPHNVVEGSNYTGWVVGSICHQHKHLEAIS